VVPPRRGGSISGMTGRPWACTKCCDGIDVPRVPYIPTKRSCEKIPGWAKAFHPARRDKVAESAKKTKQLFFASLCALVPLCGMRLFIFSQLQTVGTYAPPVARGRNPAPRLAHCNANKLTMSFPPKRESSRPPFTLVFASRALTIKWIPAFAGMTDWRVAHAWRQL
jgi:hypothetical protein